MEPKGRGTIVLFGSFVATSFLGSLLSRAHWGGDSNVLIPIYLVLGMCAGIAASHLIQRKITVIAPVCFMIAAQMILLFYIPWKQIPTAANVAAGDRYRELIVSLEKEGQVLCIDHGGFTTSSRFHVLGLLDILRAEKKMPDAIVEALRKHEYAAIVSDGKLETEGLMGEFGRNYPNSTTVKMPEPWVVTGFMTPSPERTVWISRP